MKANFGSYTIAISTTNPFGWGSAFYATFNAETYYWNSNISGSSGTHAEYHSMQVQKYSDNSWITTCSGNANFGRAGSTHRYQLSAAGCAQESWTS